MGDNCFFDDPERHDFEAGRQLELGEVGHRELATVDRGRIALVEERRDRHATQLREGVAHDRLLSHLRKHDLATAA